MHFVMCMGHIEAIPLSDGHCTVPASERTLPQSSAPSSSLPSSRRVRVRRSAGPPIRSVPPARRSAGTPSSSSSSSDSDERPLQFHRGRDRARRIPERFGSSIGSFARPGLIAGKENGTILKSEAQRIFRLFSLPPFRLSFNFHRDRGREGRRGMGAANAKEGGTGADGRVRTAAKCVSYKGIPATHPRLLDRVRDCRSRFPLRLLILP